MVGVEEEMKDYIWMYPIHFTSWLLKRLYFFPVSRYNFFYFVDGILGPKAAEWDFILDCLPNKRIKILDIGATESLFIYELNHRGYDVFALDQRPYQEKLRKEITFYLDDITKDMSRFYNMFDCITLVSAFEHIGLGEYGDKKDFWGQYKALRNVWRMLKDNGILLMTLPVAYGWTPDKIAETTKGLFEIDKMETRRKMVCVALRKIVNND